MRAGLATLKWVNVVLANTMIVAHAGLLAYLLAAWSLARVLGPTDRTMSWFVLAVVGVLLAMVCGGLLGTLVWVLNRYALRILRPAVRDRWARRLGIATFVAVALGGTVGAVELFVHRPTAAADVAL